MLKLTALGLGVAAVKDRLEKGGEAAKDLVTKANAKAKSMKEATYEADLNEALETVETLKL